jgi:hypothetical protein
MTPRPPMFVYECSSGPAENEGRYQTILLKDFWPALTPMIERYIKWMGDRKGKNATLMFHLFGSKISVGTMDWDAWLTATTNDLSAETAKHRPFRAGRGKQAAQLAGSFHIYLRWLLQRFSEARVNLYMGSLLCESMEYELREYGAAAWWVRAEDTIAPYLRIAELTGRVDFTIDASSGLDQGNHIAYGFLKWLESELARYGCKLYVEGVPSPQTRNLLERAEMFARNWIARGDNWADAVTTNTARDIVPQALTGEGVRWPAGLRKKPTRDELLDLLADVTRCGHRLAGDARFFEEDLGAANLTEYQAMAVKATTAVKGGG